MSSSPPLRQDLASVQPEASDSITNVEELLAYLDLPMDQLPELSTISPNFPLRVSQSYAKKIKPGDPSDPLLLQVLPLAVEGLDAPHFVRDPVGDIAANPVPGLVHKYHGRALLILTGACAIHCRYCFRREFPYSEHIGSKALNQALSYLKQHPEIDEIILSGGDPLVLTDRRINEAIQQLESIPHLKRLRIHSRVPIVQPDRITDELLSQLQQSRLQTIMVVHANHAQEIQDDVCAALQRMFDFGIPLFNQSVLLKGVNDSTAALKALSETLFEHHVMPYYLHLLDRVHGAAHFELDEKQTTLLFDDLRRVLPGYLVPRLVREEAGRPYKSLIFTDCPKQPSDQGTGS